MTQHDTVYLVSGKLNLKIVCGLHVLIKSPAFEVRRTQNSGQRARPSGSHASIRVCTPGPHTSSREHAAICVNIGVVSLATIHNVTIILQRSMIYTMNLT